MERGWTQHSWGEVPCKVDGTWAIVQREGVAGSSCPSPEALPDVLQGALLQASCSSSLSAPGMPVERSRLLMCFPPSPAAWYPGWCIRATCIQLQLRSCLLVPECPCSRAGPGRGRQGVTLLSFPAPSPPAGRRTDPGPPPTAMPMPDEPRSMRERLSGWGRCQGATELEGSVCRPSALCSRAARSPDSGKRRKRHCP